ncbi:MAG: tetratricopeptide repeat protein [Candidatus Omnitrophica bacterium]|nr:tetratricopeptide repeat protein [Candidatus Omnitrophota bacterium]
MASINKYRLIGLAIIVFSVYAGSLNNGFTNWDDGSHLIYNDNVRDFSLNRIDDIFVQTVLKSYIPLTILSFGIEHASFGFNPLIFHLNNILLHLLSVILIYQISLKLKFTSEVSFFSALLFGIHPIHVESVAWITERKDVLYSVFYLGALLKYLDFCESRKREDYLVSVVLGVLSLLAKPIAISLPLILILIDYYRDKTTIIRNIANKLPFFIVSVILGSLTYINHIRIPLKGIYESFLLLCWSFSFYIIKFLIPINLVPLYKLPEPVSLFNYQYVIAMFIAISVLIIFIKCGNKIVRFAIAYYILSIFFLFKLDTSETVIVADRYMYLPSYGFCLLIASYLCGICNVSKAIKAAACFLLIFAMAFLTYSQTFIWKDSVSLWSHNIKNEQEFYLPYLHRGNEFKARGMYEKAAKDYSRAIELNSNFPELFVSRANAYSSLGKYELAEMDFLRAYKIDPKSPSLHVDRGVLYIKMKQYDLALEEFSRAIQLDPKSVLAYSNRASIYVNQGRYALALQDLNKSASINQFLPGTFYNRSICRSLTRDIPGAIEDAIKAKSLGMEGLEQYIEILKSF